MNTGNKVYFANLDALRFFAFFGVFISHAWAVTLPGMHISPFLQHLKMTVQIGSIGVNFFFILSGFLITYLLFIERNKSGTNNLLQFYVRRSLRIWPLYFGILLISFFVVPFIFSITGKSFYEPSKIIYFLCFAVNFQELRGIMPYSPLLAVLWSIAVEEQFYVAWAPMFKYFFKKIEWLFLFIIISSLIMRAIYIHNEKIIYFHTFSIMSDFAIGGYLAYIACYKNKIYHIITSIPKKYIVLFYIFFIVILAGYNYIFSSAIATIFERVILGTMFAFIIFEQTFCINSFFNAGNVKLFTWLGKISYGLYCFHELGIILAKDLLLHFNILFQPLQFMILLPAIAFMITVFISWLSYNFYERWFLQWKEKFYFSEKI